ncbi:MAG: SUMF1/EgtB/PvdO family nonheme iron enzyme [Kiloniellales bacterium]|nr:SUMF1/EgtB/PvdO family nonheme iron enzyme [Kiloniellales bacterium]
MQTFSGSGVSRREFFVLSRGVSLGLLAGSAFLAKLHPIERAYGSGQKNDLIPELISIPAGLFWSGSDQNERELAYRLDEAAYGHTRTRELKWYDREYKKKRRSTDAYRITKTLITNRQYREFVDATGHRAPDVNEATWRSYRLIHPYSRTRRHAWKDGSLPDGREDHPVVLISHGDAEAYANWLSKMTGEKWRLPTWKEWEKAARGIDGRIFPWGDDWDAGRLNSHDAGPFDTLPVGSFPQGASPFGMLDPAGQVFEWTSSATADGRYEVRGGSWDDSGCGVCRPAARHSRPEHLKHILIGFRLVIAE